MSEKSAPSQITAQAASGAVLVKLAVFSLSLGVVPIASYFGSLKYVWNGNATYAAITAIVAANLVLVSYIISSVMDDRGSNEPSKIPAESKKER
ncbi:hypothetical protein JOM56_008694 [Amanita muscaria]|uniref:Vacuolar ATPase assembly integral membrane protein VMA21 n=1 Tax=Amanita muscaria (strain Koide BX008) TaxID=946122 RepID=A0A0C2XM22_AMAMK|nr:hypothetical protein M378DRAFT_20650 [Amanita muscaria Koide BX008]